MEEPYPTVKRWWKAVKEGPFFSEAIDRGRRGWRVKFRPVWIDLRILSTRPIAADPSSTTQGSEMILEDTKVEVQTPQGHFKDISRTNEGSEMILEDNVYGTQDSYQAKEIDDAKISRTSSPKKKADAPTPKPIRETLAEVCGIGRISTREQQLQVNQSAAQIWKEQERAGLDADRTVKDIRHTASYFQKNDWRGKKGDRPTPAQIREVWVAAHTNGHRPNGQIPGDLPLFQADPSKRLTPEEQTAAAARRRAIREESRSAGK